MHVREATHDDRERIVDELLIPSFKEDETIDPSFNELAENALTDDSGRKPRCSRRE